MTLLFKTFQNKIHSLLHGLQNPVYPGHRLFFDSFLLFSPYIIFEAPLLSSIPETHQVHSHCRAQALAIPSAWKTQIPMFNDRLFFSIASSILTFSKDLDLAFQLNIVTSPPLLNLSHNLVCFPSAIYTIWIYFVYMFNISLTH